MNCYLLIDFGSTYTKLCLVDIDEEKIIARSSAYSTVDTSIIDGYNNAVDKLKDKVDLSSINIIDSLACSSAAGGLKLVAIGITPLYTVEAARESALGAGARILKSYGYFLDHDDIREIDNLRPDMILLSGGAEGGNTHYIIENGKKLIESKLDIPIIVAGNTSANPSLERIFSEGNKDFYITENLMPDVNMINPEPVREVIRENFMKRIVYAKGLEGIDKITSNLLMPTPTAVLKAAELLANGPDAGSGKGDIMVVDVGGATTDVHSISDPLKDKSYLLDGLEDPYIKRTVEGDLGMRYSSLAVYECVGEESFLKYNKNLKNIREECDYRHRNPGVIMETEGGIEFDEIIAKNCVDRAVRRHSATIRKSYYGGREVVLQKGKDMRFIDMLIGTGGIIVNSQDPREILKSASQKYPNTLMPDNPDMYVDKNYIMSAMGLLSMKDKNLAYKILEDNIIKVC